jgi:hypothetical protein
VLIANYRRAGWWLGCAGTLGCVVLSSLLGRTENMVTLVTGFPLMALSVYWLAEPHRPARRDGGAP